jgi:hypothetical protein
MHFIWVMTLKSNYFDFRFALSPYRPIALSPYRPIALSPYRPIALSPYPSLNNFGKSKAVWLRIDIDRVLAQAM